MCVERNEMNPNEAMQLNLIRYRYSYNYNYNDKYNTEHIYDMQRERDNKKNKTI